MPLDASGNPIALSGSPPVPAATPRCIKDLVTNLVWEVKTNNNPKDVQDKDYIYAWGGSTPAVLGTCGLGSGTTCNTDNYIAAVNALDLCGETANNWRLPTRLELLSIVDNGLESPAIDTAYFPYTVSNGYWSGDASAFDPTTHAWNVRFDVGDTRTPFQIDRNYVRLVRNGP